MTQTHSVIGIVQLLACALPQIPTNSPAPPQVSSLPAKHCKVDPLAWPQASRPMTPP